VLQPVTGDTAGAMEDHAFLTIGWWQWNDDQNLSVLINTIDLEFVSIYAQENLVISLHPKDSI